MKAHTRNKKRNKTQIGCCQPMKRIMSLEITLKMSELPKRGKKQKRNEKEENKNKRIKGNKIRDTLFTIDHIYSSKLMHLT